VSELIVFWNYETVSVVTASGRVDFEVRRQVIVKQEVLDEVTRKLELSGLKTPEGATKKKAAPLQQTPIRTPESKSPPPKRRSFRRSKKERLDDDDDSEAILKDITFAPVKAPQKVPKRRGRPRKLVFEDCGEPEPKVSKVDNLPSA